MQIKKTAVNYSKDTGNKTSIIFFKQTMDAVLPCLSGSVSEGWRDRTVRYDDLHLGTTGGEEDGDI